MRGKSRIKLRLILFLIIACISIGFVMAFKLISFSKGIPTFRILPDANTPSAKVITYDTILSELKQKQELISLEVELTEKVTINDSWGNVEIFKKFQNIHVSAKGIYSLDLSKISTNNLFINTNNNSLEISVPKPLIKSITIDEEKTVFETTQNGLLRFGEIQLTPVEHQNLLSNAKKNMYAKMSSEDIFSEARTSSELALKNFINSIIGNENSYNITIEFK